MSEDSEMFDGWAKEIGLLQKTIDLLGKQDLCDLKALRVFNLDTVKLLKLSMGQEALLVDGVIKLQGKGTPTPGTQNPGTSSTIDTALSNLTQESILSQLRADQTLQETVNSAAGVNSPWSELLLAAQKPAGATGAGPVQNAVFDPIYYLKPKSACKYYDITEFISPKKGEFEEVISSKEGMEIVIRSQDRGSKKVQLSAISVTQWNIANVSILYQLILDGALAQASISDYLAYSVKILELSFHHEWESVLLYDREYRSKQAAYGFRWGTDPPHLGSAILVPRSKVYKQLQDKRPAQQAGSKFRRPTTRKGEEICMGFNAKAGCRWGTNCRFLHVCSERGCEDKHAQFDHPKG